MKIFEKFGRRFCCDLTPPLDKNKTLRVSDLSRILKTSVVTIRKDLDELEQEGADRNIVLIVIRYQDIKLIQIRNMRKSNLADFGIIHN